VLCLKMIGHTVWSSSQDSTIFVWDKNTWKVLKVLKQKEDVVTCLEVAGKRVWSASSIGNIKIWNKKHYKSMRELKVDASVGSMLWMGPNHMWIGTDKSVIILDATSTKCVTLPGHTAMVHGIVKVNDMVWTCSSDKSVKIWSESGRLIKTIEGHSGRVFSIICIGETHVWTSSWDTSIIIWNAKDFTFQQELKGLHKDAITSLLPIERDAHVGCVWSGSWDASVGCWKYKNYVHAPLIHPIINMQGFMLKQGGEIKTWKTRWFVLSKGYLSYYESRYDEEPIHSVNVRSCPLREEPPEVVGRRFCFSIESFEPRKSIERRKFVMCCDSEEDRRSWVEQLRIYSVSARKSF